MTHITALAEEAFIERFQPQPNRLVPTTSLDFGEGGCLYETFGVEYEAIRQADMRCVWTLLDEDGLLLVSGWRFVNRLGYLLCEVPVPEGEAYIVDLDEGDAS